jgi:Fe-S oxidoreductase
MESTRHCGDGGNFQVDPLSGGENSPARRRVREGCETGATILAVACPKCLAMLNDAVKLEELGNSLAVMDIFEIATKTCRI